MVTFDSFNDVMLYIQGCFARHGGCYGFDQWLKELEPYEFKMLVKSVNKEKRRRDDEKRKDG